MKPYTENSAELNHPVLKIHNGKHTNRGQTKNIGSVICLPSQLYIRSCQTFKSSYVQLKKLTFLPPLLRDRSSFVRYWKTFSWIAVLPNLLMMFVDSSGFMV